MEDVARAGAMLDGVAGKRLTHQTTLIVCIETSLRTNVASQTVTLLIGFGCRNGDCVALEMIVDCAKQLNLFSHFEGAEGGSW